MRGRGEEGGGRLAGHHGIGTTRVRERLHEGAVVEHEAVAVSPRPRHPKGQQRGTRLDDQQSESPVKGGEVPLLAQVADHDRRRTRLGIVGNPRQVAELRCCGLGDEERDRRPRVLGEPLVCRNSRRQDACRVDVYPEAGEFGGQV